MKAILLKRAGRAKGLVLTEVPIPIPGQTEVLIRIHATTVTRGDVVLRKLPKLLTRLVGETPKSTLGHEFAGVVTAVGAMVDRFEVGNRVFGTTTGLTHGAYSEYLCAPQDGILATIPSGITFEDAAPVPVGAMAALHFLREGGVVSDKRVLINGASGSVGSFAVQIAKQLGAHVTGVSSTSNVELVESLGADEVIDYTKQDFTEGSQRYDVIFDAVGKTSPKRTRSVLAEHGMFVTTQKLRQERLDDLLAVRDLVAAGVVKAVIDRYYTLEQIPEAHQYVEQGHKRGNVVILVSGR
ncbi:MAG: NAD(P)-dependent alcohol dehydrogenase [Trueperaceae bacterium]|nr:MAG: NAD(P)-dependent alcohol dehydrogenase [Trueperaceae bacterium]